MKYFTEEILTTKDGKTACAIYEKTSMEEALSAYYQTMASNIINDDVIKIYASAKNDEGGIYEEKLLDKTNK